MSEASCPDSEAPRLASGAPGADSEARWVDSEALRTTPEGSGLVKEAFQVGSKALLAVAEAQSSVCVWGLHALVNAHDRIVDGVWHLERKGMPRVRQNRQLRPGNPPRKDVRVLRRHQHVVITG